MRISDWSSDVCSSDLRSRYIRANIIAVEEHGIVRLQAQIDANSRAGKIKAAASGHLDAALRHAAQAGEYQFRAAECAQYVDRRQRHARDRAGRSEERGGGKECVGTCETRG